MNLCQHPNIRAVKDAAIRSYRTLNIFNYILTDWPPRLALAIRRPFHMLKCKFYEK